MRDLEQIKDLISQNRLDEAFSDLKKWTEGSDDLNRNLSALTQQHTDFKDQDMMGLLSFAERNLMKARITNSLLGLIGKIKSLSSEPANLPVGPPAAPPKRTILFLAANPQDTAPLSIDNELAEVKNRLAKSENRDKFHVEYVPAVTVGDIQDALMKEKPYIVHFSGHGANTGELIIQAVPGPFSDVHLLEPRGVGQLMELFSDTVECVVLNACYSEKQASEIVKYIPYVVGMSKRIGDKKAAIPFAGAFYAALGNGRDIDFAFKLAKNSIPLSGSKDGEVPVLKKRNLKSEIKDKMRMNYRPWFSGFVVCWLILQVILAQPSASSKLHKKDLFPFQADHVHGSTIVELPDGNLLAAWFQGSGERRSDDVAIMGARFNQEKQAWSEVFVMADVPDFPDINPVLFIDQQDRLWLLWYTVLANQWETSFLKYRLSENYLGPGAPDWQWQEMIHMKPAGETGQGIQPDDAFVRIVQKKFKDYYTYLDTSGTFGQWGGREAAMRDRFNERVQEILDHAGGLDMVASGSTALPGGKRISGQKGFPRFRRMGWQTRNKPLFLASGRMIIPLYSDGFDFSIMAISDDGGKHWRFSEPLVGLGPVQPALLQRTDGTILAMMRDNGPPPQRLMMSHSKDNGLTWSPVVDSEIPNSGSAAEMVKLTDGRWLLANNDLEDGRHSLAVHVSDDEGQTWKILLHAEQDEPGTARSHYPAIIQDKSGRIHLLYSYHTRDSAGNQRKTIRHTWFR